MGRLIDGEWTTHDLGPDENGRYVRRAAKFRDRITADGSSGFSAAAGRYHLYLAHACGWSHRTLLFRELLGLQDAVSVSFVEPFMGDQGWTLAPGADPLLGKAKLYEIYLEHQRDYTGRVSVPVLWDRQTGAIVTNESSEITRDFDREFRALTKTPLELFPAELEAEIDAMITANYGPVNNGVYRCGFAGSQAAYEEALTELFTRLEQLEQLLGERRYLVGGRLTAADLYLFPTLYRFDSIYYIHFKCCLRQLRDFPNLWAYTRELHQLPGVARTCDMAATREHYFRSHESINPRRFVPPGPRIDFDAPHGRDALT